METLPFDVAQIIFSDLLPDNIWNVELVCKAWLRCSRQRIHLKTHHVLMKYHFDRYPNLRIVNAPCMLEVTIERLMNLTGPISINDTSLPQSSIQGLLELAKTHTIYYRVLNPVEVRRMPSEFTIVGRKSIQETLDLHFILTQDKLTIYHETKSVNCGQLIDALPSHYCLEICKAYLFPTLSSPIRYVIIHNQSLASGRGPSMPNLCRFVTDTIKMPLGNKFWEWIYDGEPQPKPKLVFN